MTERHRIAGRSQPLTLLAVLLPLLAVAPGAAGPALADAEFRRGDANADGGFPSRTPS